MTFDNSILLLLGAIFRWWNKAQVPMIWSQSNTYTSYTSLPSNKWQLTILLLLSEVVWPYSANALQWNKANVPCWRKVPFQVFNLSHPKKPGGGLTSAQVTTATLRLLVNSRSQWSSAKCAISWSLKASLESLKIFFASQPSENMNTRDRQISLHADVFMGFGFLKRGGWRWHLVMFGSCTILQSLS